MGDSIFVVVVVAVVVAAVAVAVVVVAVVVVVVVVVVSKFTRKPMKVNEKAAETEDKLGEEAGKVEEKEKAYIGAVDDVLVANKQVHEDVRKAESRLRQQRKFFARALANTENSALNAKESLKSALRTRMNEGSV